MSLLSSWASRREGLLRRLAWPRLILVAFALSALLSIPALRAGYFLDDHLNLNRLELGPGTLRSAAELYCLTSCQGGSLSAVAHGPIPWWNDPQARVDLLRPLSGLLFAAEHAIAPRDALFPHLLSLLWFGALLVAVRSLYARLSSRAAAGLALLLFAIDDAHWQPIGWLANRHALVATVPVLFGVAAHVRAREDGYRPGIALSLPCYVVGLLGGESAVGAMAYLFAYELTAPGRLRERIRALAPAAAVLAAYLIAYRALGYGARGHEQYVDPAGEPARFGAAMATHVPALVADLLAGFPSDLWPAMPALHGAFIAVGLLAAAIVGALLRAPLRAMGPDGARRVRWLALGGLGALVPGAAALPGSRLLLMPSVGGAAVIAVILVHFASVPARLPARAGAVLLGLVHVLVAPVALVATLLRISGIARTTERLARQAEIAPARDPASVDVVVLHVPDLLTMLYPPLIRRLDPATRERSWWTLSMAPHAHRLTRTGLTSFRLETVDGAFFASEWERLFRPARRALAPGDQVELPGLTVRVVSASALDVDLHRPLEDPSLRFVSYRDGALRNVAPPPLGAEIVLPAERGLLEL